MSNQVRIIVLITAIVSFVIGITIGMPSEPKSYTDDQVEKLILNFESELLIKDIIIGDICNTPDEYNLSRECLEFDSIADERDILMKEMAL